MRTRDYSVNGIMITDCPRKAHEYNMSGIASMTEAEVCNIRSQIDEKMPKSLKSLICLIKTTIGGTVERICLKKNL